MTETVEVPAVREWDADAAALRRARWQFSLGSAVFPRERRGRLVRAAASAMLVAVSFWAAERGTAVPYAIGSLGVLALLNADLPWLWRIHRLDRTPLARTALTFRAFGVPTRWRLVLSTDTMAWTTTRDGVLHDVVVGDVLVADLGKNESPVILTHGDRRSIGPGMFRLTPERFQTLTGAELGTTVDSPPA